MNRIITYILGGITVVLFILLLLAQGCNNSKDKEIAGLQKLLYECTSAPVNIDTIHDTIYLPQAIIKPKPKPIPVDVQPVISSSPREKCDNISSTYYSEAYKQKGVSLHWEAMASCSGDSAKLEYIRFDNIIVPKQIITLTKKVPTPVAVETPLKSKFIIYGGVVGNSIKNFPGIEGGVGYLHKQNWGIQLGGIYLNDSPYISAKIFVAL
jgi:hypothetical protein